MRHSKSNFSLSESFIFINLKLFKPSFLAVHENVFFFGSFSDLPIYLVENETFAGHLIIIGSQRAQFFHD